MAHKITSAERIMKKLSLGPEALAKRLGIDRSTVSRWMYPESRGGTGGHIPWKHHKAIKRMAKRLGVVLVAEDFVEV